MTSLNKKRIKIKVTGRVQGVGYRFFTQRSACTLGVKGYVKNEADGSVTIEAEGTPIQLEQFIKFAERGPQWASVVSVEKEEVKALNDQNFIVF